MLRFQLLFFASTALGAVALARFAPAVFQAPKRYAYIFAGSWLASASLLFLGTWLLMPNDPTLYFPTSVAAQLVPLLGVAAALSLVSARWSLEGKTLLALSISALFAVFALLFILVATCVVQSNCL